MTDPDQLAQPGPEECSDLEYDLAHEAVTSTGGALPDAARKPEPTYVATESDYDGDYGYDLAHDIPKP
ncbi:MAG TPA: hypothetical protein VFU36_13895 [Jatrophihabitans sp.]|nr:hypothetical protein [Jatrophihabitans sp.]